MEFHRFALADVLAQFLPKLDAWVRKTGTSWEELVQALVKRLCTPASPAEYMAYVYDIFLTVSAVLKPHE